MHQETKALDFETFKDEDMNEKIKAADDIRSLARMYKNMQAAADALQNIGQMEQAAQESQAALEAARAELAAAQDETAAEKAKAKDLKKKNEATVLAAEQSAADIIKAAEQAAEAKGAALIAAAQSKAVDIQRDASDAVKPILDGANKLRGDVAELKVQRDALATDITAKTAEAERAEANLAKVKAQINKLAGA